MKLRIILICALLACLAPSLLFAREAQKDTLSRGGSAGGEPAPLQVAQAPLPLPRAEQSTPGSPGPPPMVPQPGTPSMPSAERPQVAPPAEPAPAPRGRPSALASAPPPGSLVQMQFDNIELRDLIKFVSTIMGKNFIFDEQLVKGRVTILSPRSLTKEEVFRVFESVLHYNGFSVVETQEAYKIVKSADAKAMAVQSFNKKTLDPTMSGEKVSTLVYPLEYLDASTMVGIMRPLLGRDAYLAGVPATNSLIMIDSGANLMRLEKLLSELDIPVSKQLSTIDVYNVQHTSAADLAKVLQQLLAEGKRAQTPKEKIFVTAYAPTNSLLVSAPAEDMREIRRIIQDIDTFRPQVLVEAAIMEVSVTKGSSLGVEWIAGAKVGTGRGVAGALLNSGSPMLTIAGAIAGGTTTTTGTTTTGSNIATTAAGVLSGFSMGVIGDTINFNGQQYPSISALIRAVATEDDVNILSTPQILTLNNEEAEIIVGENRPYLTSTRLDSAGNAINTFDYRDVGVKLKVKPYINKDGFVYLNIYQEVTKVTIATAGSGTSVQPAPTSLKRATKTVIGVKDGQTVVISGLIQDDMTGHREGIPLLQSIPLLGSLFGTRTRTSEKTNLLVFITPRIVYSSDVLEKLSNEKRSQQEDLIRKESNAGRPVPGPRANP